MSAYQPEIGQALFGQPSQPIECPVRILAALERLRDEWQGKVGFMATPFSNSGERYDGKNFSAHAYSWDEDEGQEWNFKWRDLRVSWYKYLGRGMSCNRAISYDEATELLAECLAEIGA